MLHHRHELDVREAEVLDVVAELVRELEIGETPVAPEGVPPPRAEVHLVDRDRRAQRVGAPARGDPLLVRPLVLRAPDDGGGVGRNLRVERERVGLDPQAPLLRADLELVRRAFDDTRYEQLPDAGGTKRAHRVQATVPRVEVADDRNGARVRGPAGKRRADGAVDLAYVRTELLVQLLVAAFH